MVSSFNRKLEDLRKTGITIRLVMKTRDFVAERSNAMCDFNWSKNRFKAVVWICLLAYPLTLHGFQTEIGGPLRGEQTWVESKSPYIVIQNVEVTQGFRVSVPGHRY